MHISTVENRTGLTRANIRFYEAQGFLRPDRLENGYRDYNDGHVETLLKIRLLRQLRFPLEEIRALQSGELPLDEAMERQILQLQAEIDRLETACRVCGDIRAAGADYAGLDARKYLDALENPARPANKAWMARDTAQVVAHPWWRWAALMVDGMIYNLPVTAIYCLVFDNFYTGGELYRLLLVLYNAAALVLLEPLLLKWFGTTPGKWIFGIRVVNWDGNRLTYNQGFWRAWDRLRYGFGFYIPFYSIYRYYRSYCQCQEGQLLWDEDISYTYKDEKQLRWAAAAGAVVLVIALEVLIGLQAQLPPNRGDLTVAEFAENYNFYIKNMVSRDYPRELDENGQWADEQSSNAVIYVGDYFTASSFAYTVEDGRLTAVTCTMAAIEGFPGFMRDMQMTVLSFAGAQKGINVWNNGLGRLSKALLEQDLYGFTYRQAGVVVTWETEIEGEIEFYVGDWAMAYSPDGTGSCTAYLTVALE